MNKVVFLTGATGFVGSNLAARILRQDLRARLIVLVRGTTQEEAEARFWGMLKTVAPDLQNNDATQRVAVVLGDISRERLGLSDSDYDKVVTDSTHVIHSAASVDFRQSLEKARAINCGGTRNVLGIARVVHQKGNLRLLAYIGTAYACGSREGVVYETDRTQGATFSNSYEQSKYEAEQIIEAEGKGLPIVILRPSIIVGDSRTGVTTSFNVLYVPLRFILQGLIQRLPGSPSTMIDIVPIDFVTDAAYHILFRTRHCAGRVYHLTAGVKAASATGQVVAQAIEFFNQVMKTRMVRTVSFVPDEAGSPDCGGTPGGGAMERVIATFEPYISRSLVFDNRNTMFALRKTAIHPPRFEEYCAAIMRYFIESLWTRELKQAA